MLIWRDYCVDSRQLFTSIRSIRIDETVCECNGISRGSFKMQIFDGKALDDERKIPVRHQK